jgi:hypothetical protein
MSKLSAAHDDVLEALSATREKVRLELHLLSADARQKWDELDAKILALQGEVGSRAEALADKTAEMAMELSDSVKRFVDSHVRNAQR